MLYGKVIKTSLLTDSHKKRMYALMDEFYDQTNVVSFLDELSEKDFCILLCDEASEIQGFSTQQLVTIQVDGRNVSGVFSGDTIIHRDHWGSLELFKAFATFFLEHSKNYEEFYWFLISKGYKTYKMLPVFFKEFYPNYRMATPENLQAIMDAFGRLKYPREYHKPSGVIRYQSVKDKVKPGTADLTSKQLKDGNVAFFVKRNPDYVVGHDLVCLAPLSEENIRYAAKRLLGIS